MRRRSFLQIGFMTLATSLVSWRAVAQQAAPQGQLPTPGQAPLPQRPPLGIEQRRLAFLLGQWEEEVTYAGRSGEESKGSGRWFARPDDLTGVFCTSGSAREFTEEDRWYADEEIQARADRNPAAAD